MSGQWSHWDAIRAAWDIHFPAILSGVRVSPYFYNWSMTPIEAASWQELREHGLPLYPQCPVGYVFIDFGDPVLRIGLELDGKDFHDYERDQSRDTALWRDHGWRIIRIGGGSCYEKIGSPTGADFADGAERDTKEYLDDWAIGLRTPRPASFGRWPSSFAGDSPPNKNFPLHAGACSHIDA